MKRVNLHLIAAAFVTIAAFPLPVRAETLFTPWLGGNTGIRNVSSTIDVGASVGATAAGVIGVDFDFGYSPVFFGNGLNSHVLTAMGNVSVGIPIGGTSSPGVRPYVTGGIGLIRARLESPFYGYSIANTDVGVNFGGGVTGFVANHLGVRADLRYIQSLEDNYSVSPFNQLDLGGFHYWRTSIGLVLR